MSNPRTGSTIVGFRIESPRATRAAADIVEQLNQGQLKDHGVVSARVASYASTTVLSPDIAVAPYLRRTGLRDRIIATIMIVLYLPVLAMLASLVRLTSAGRAFFWQRRVGMGGKDFSMLKLRTMSIDAEVMSGPQWSMRGDPRVTSVGRILRYLSLDELPQLLNVLRGEMALIGPRPERPEITAVLEKSIPSYTSRLLVKPGIVGLHTPNLPSDASLEDVRRKLLVDRYYIQHATLTMDCKIVLDICCRMLGLRFRLTKGFVDQALSAR